MDIIEYINKDKSIALKRPSISPDTWKIMSQYFKNEGHVYFCSSGTSDNVEKVFCVEIDTLINHSKEVSRFYDILEKQNWLVSLPEYYIGGLSLYFRSYVTNGNLYYLNDYSIESILKSVEQNRINYFSLVPYQLKDFINKKLVLPSCVKKVFIGGDIFSDTLLEQIDERFIYTFGLSETCSQFSYYCRNSKVFTCYPFANIKMSQDQHLIIVSPYHVNSILKFKDNKIITEKQESVIVTNDIIELIDEKTFKYLGRSDRKVKSKGIFFHLDEIEKDYIKKHPNHLMFLTHSNDEYSNKVFVVFKGNINKDYFLKLKIYDFLQIESFKLTDSGKVIKRIEEYTTNRSKGT